MPPRCDEGANTESYEEQAEKRHTGFLHDSDWMREDGATTQADDINIGGDRAKEEQQRDRNGDVHPEHAPLRVLKLLAMTPKRMKSSPAPAGMSAVGWALPVYTKQTTPRTMSRIPKTIVSLAKMIALRGSYLDCTQLEAMHRGEETQG